MLILAAALGVFLSAQPKQVARNDYEAIAELCGKRSVILKAVDATILCIDGPLDGEAVRVAGKADYRIDYVVTNSPGGDVRRALDLGRKMFRDRSVLIVAGTCMSSCANYLVPASAGVVVLGPSAIVLHGSIPANLIAYTARSRPDGSGESLDKVTAAYRRDRDGIIREEADFFDTILIDKSYVDRYRELAASLRYGCKPKCPAYRDIYLALDRGYLEHYGIHVLEWRGEPLYRRAVKLRFGGAGDIGLMVGFLGEPAG